MNVIAVHECEYEDYVFDDDDSLRWCYNELLEKKIKEIPGQKSGLSFKYFLMLVGNENLIKPDRMIIRY